MAHDSATYKRNLSEITPPIDRHCFRVRGNRTDFSLSRGAGAGFSIATHHKTARERARYPPSLSIRPEVGYGGLIGDTSHVGLTGLFTMADILELRELLATAYFRRTFERIVGEHSQSNGGIRGEDIELRRKRRKLHNEFPAIS